MPLVAVLLVLLSLGTLLLYVLPAARARLGDYVQDRTLARAATTATAVSGSDREDLQGALNLAAKTGGGQVLVVEEDGDLLASAGPQLLSPLPAEIRRAAASGRRTNEEIGELRAATVPLIRDGSLDGGVVYVAGDSEGSVYEIFLRSGAEAAAIASVLGGGLALLLATLISRRVERLTVGARSIEQGDLAYRIEPGFDDELGELAKSFNAMAEKLQNSFLQLKEKSATLNAILNNLSEGVLATDLRGKVMFTNLAVRAMTGLGSEGPFDRVPDVWEDFDLPGAVDRCANQQECVEARVSDGDNIFRVKLEHLAEFDDHRGGVLVVVQDLSEGRRLEANQHRFLANAAHELKTPITAILGSAELLLTEEEDDPEVRQRFLSHISSEAKRMQRLSETLLRLARTGSDLREPEIVPVNLSEVAREAVERMEPLAESAGIALRIEGRGSRVKADREWLEQCLLIVLGNALQHSGEAEEVRIVLEGSKIAVEDEGIGISEEDLPYVFERFYRSKSGSEGFGLGLPICKELVERMGGSIHLWSERGTGTKVEIELSGEARDA
jgi:two-component system sensor histidine kinase VicK